MSGKITFYRVERREVGSDAWATTADNSPTHLGAQKYVDYLPGRCGVKRFGYSIMESGK